MASISRPAQDGLGWKETLLDLVPQWTREPSIAAIESVCRHELSIPPDDPCTIALHTSGLFNKLYTVKYTRGILIMRVSLPVYPRHKTRAEVATLRWVRENTKVPVPEVFKFDDSNDNEIGYEWVLMELMQGAPAHRRWRTMSMEQKVAFTKQIAIFQAELSGLGKDGPLFRSIGTLDLRDMDKEYGVEGSEKAVPGLLVMYELFKGDRLHYDIARGPFRSSHDWLSAWLNIILLHQTTVLKKAAKEDDKEEAEEILVAARKLLSLISNVFPPDLAEPEATGLYHHGLYLSNILVNQEGDITAVLGWGCVSALPLWLLADFPQFLEEPVREEEPQRDMYSDETPEEAAVGAEKRNDPDYLDNEGKNQLYFIHRMEYEATQLRKVYEEELWRERQPLQKSYAKSDFLQAVAQCDGIWVKRSHKWADCMEKGEIIRWEDV